MEMGYPAYAFGAQDGVEMGQMQVPVIPMEGVREKRTV